MPQLPAVNDDIDIHGKLSQDIKPSALIDEHLTILDSCVFLPAGGGGDQAGIGSRDNGKAVGHKDCLAGLDYRRTRSRP